MISLSEHKMLLSLFVLLSFSWGISANNIDNFINCLSLQPNSSFSNLIYTQNNPLYHSVLDFTLQNYRFKAPNTPKPLVIITPLEVAHVQITIKCARINGVRVRLRSGGHDYDGRSYVSPLPYVILDLIKFRSIDIDVPTKTAWVQSAATIGELYYKIANLTKTLAFPAGICPSVGVGGHFSGGAYGILMRKYGLSVDNVIDVHAIDVNGKFLDRKSMGEDLFWAICGGGGNTFAVVLSWKINLVDVPAKVSVFAISRQQNVAKLATRWQQVADKFDKDIFTIVFLNSINGTANIRFTCMFLGGPDRLVSLMQQSFPELGVKKQDISETTWAKSDLFVSGFPEAPLEKLLDRTPVYDLPFKAKSDYVKVPIPEHAWGGVFEKFNEPEGRNAFMLMVAYGGRMSEIPESATPFPHRAGIICKLMPLVLWKEDAAAQRHIDWIRRLHSYLTPYVTNNPRQAYVNYRDLDIGINNINGVTTYQQASVWGTKYFVKNFDRLVKIKTRFDPTNFLSNEQTIPPYISFN